MTLIAWLIGLLFVAPGHPTETAGHGHGTVQAGDTRPSDGSLGPESHRALLDSLGQCAGTTPIREYLTENGDLGRQFASSQPLEQAVDTVTMFYRNKLSRLGWKTIEEHAAVSAYQKGSQVLAILRAGPDDPGLPPRAKLLWAEPVPADAKFFFDVEAGTAR